MQELFRSLVLREPAGLDLYFRCADLYRALRARGITVRSTIDCLIAMLAAEHGCSVLARDRDLDEILGSGLVKASLFPFAVTTEAVRIITKPRRTRSNTKRLGQRSS